MANISSHITAEKPIILSMPALSVAAQESCSWIVIMGAASRDFHNFNFKNFFEQRGGFPSFKSKHDRQSVSYPQNVKTQDKARKLFAKVNSKIKRVREDFLHKLSRKIVNENQVIVVEDLNIKGIVRNHCLAKAISDAGWEMFATMLKYKAEMVGKVYLEIGRFFPSSKTCNQCLFKVSEMNLKTHEWKCPECETVNDRDINAALNIRG